MQEKDAYLADIQNDVCRLFLLIYMLTSSFVKFLM